jgi:hypothetical protein
VRGLFRTVFDAARAAAPDEDGFDAEARRAHTELLREPAAVVRAFGRLLGAESTGRGPQQAESDLGAALRGLRAARARAGELLPADPKDHPAPSKLNSAFAVAADRMLAELDVVEHARLREERRREAARRRTARGGAAAHDEPPGRRSPAAAADAAASGRRPVVVD